MKKILIAAGTIAIVLGTTAFFKANNGSLPIAIVPDSANAGLQLPTGVSALVVADNIGRSRHLA
jgi:hypothetical protein